MNLNEIVPWGRNLTEYVGMFRLDNAVDSLSILGCGDGPASFNAEATALGWNVVSVDPIYRFSKDELAARIEEVRVEIMHQVRSQPANYIWTDIESPNALETLRTEAMSAFVSDFELGKAQSRYIDSSLPVLPFSDKQFDLALCSNFLFLYSGHFSEADHLASIHELCRVAKEVRIYPLLTIENNTVSPHLARVRAELETKRLKTELVTVQYEFQKGATQMLKISNPL